MCTLDNPQCSLPSVSCAEMHPIYFIDFHEGKNVQTKDWLAAEGLAKLSRCVTQVRRETVWFGLHPLLLRAVKNWIWWLVWLHGRVNTGVGSLQCCFFFFTLLSALLFPMWSSSIWVQEFRESFLFSWAVILQSGQQRTNTYTQGDKGYRASVVWSLRWRTIKWTQRAEVCSCFLIQVIHLQLYICNLSTLNPLKHPSTTNKIQNNLMCNIRIMYSHIFRKEININPLTSQFTQRQRLITAFLTYIS